MPSQLKLNQKDRHARWLKHVVGCSGCMKVLEVLEAGTRGFN